MSILGILIRPCHNRSFLNICFRPQLTDCIKMLLKKDDPITDIDLPVGGSPILVRPRQFVKIENMIQCPKDLKVLLDERNDKVIETELENTFSGF